MKTNAEKAKAWRLRNQDRIREYRMRNAEKRGTQYREWMKRHPEKLKEYRERHSSERAEYLRDWRRANQDKVRAYTRKPERLEARLAWDLVARARISGKLSRPNRCSKCHKACVPEGHHEDYSKPLEVIWLCKQCHNRVSPKIRH